MTREILFRGKRTDNGEWVYGFYFEENHLGLIKYGIIRYERLEGKDVSYEVDPSTIGQFTGLLDKNGTKIFEGDVLNVMDWGIKPSLIGTSFIEWDTEENGWNFHELLIEDRYDFRRCFPHSLVIGNIHDKEADQ